MDKIWKKYGYQTYNKKKDGWLTDKISTFPECIRELKSQGKDKGSEKQTLL